MEKVSIRSFDPNLSNKSDGLNDVLNDGLNIGLKDGLNDGLNDDLPQNQNLYEFIKSTNDYNVFNLNQLIDENTNNVDNIDNIDNINNIDNIGNNIHDSKYTTTKESSHLDVELDLELELLPSDNEIISNMSLKSNDLCDKPTISNISTISVTFLKSSTIDYSNYTFLLVDDNLINLFILKRILFKIFPNSKLIYTLDSTKVEYYLNSVKFDLIFLDIEMPILSGIDLTKIVRNRPELDYLGLIAVTSRHNDDDLHLYKSIGIDYTLKKPLIGWDNLIDTVKSVIESRKYRLKKT